MSRIAGVILTVFALSLGLVLTGCESFDPTSIFDVLSTKKRLPGERQPVFPEGTPGVSQGVPPEMVKGYQPPPEPEPAQAAAEPKAKPKPKPKPKVVASPKEESKPTAVTVRPSSQSQSQAQWPDPPPR
jgi:type IV secretory pathway VirB10-like protein